MKKIFLIILILMITSAIFINEYIGKPKGKSVINLAIDNPVKSFDPAIAFNNDSLFVIGQSLETLYQYHYLKRPFEVIPLLADGMPEISTDGLKYTFKIKQNVKYHNGDNVFKSERFVKAQDFVNQIKRLAFRPLKSTGNWLFAGKLKGFNSFTKTVGNDFSKFLSEDIEGLKAIDDLTFEIELNEPEPNLLYFLAMPFTTPVPIELLNKYKNSLSEVLVGTGPYEFVKRGDQKYIFKKFKHYHSEFYPSSGDRYANTENLLSSSKKKLPFIDFINFHIVQKEDVKWEMFKTGDLDILDVPRRWLPELSKQNSNLNKEFKKLNIDIKHFSRQTTRWFGFNMNDVVMKNINIRKAIAHAINYEKYIELITNNTSLKANSMFNPSIPGYKPSHSLGYSYDPVKAKKFLELSGYKPRELKIVYSTRGKQEIHYEEAEFIQSYLNEIGINVEIQTLSFSEFLKKGRGGKLQFWTDNWIYDYPDAENILQLLISKNHPGINKSGYSNPRVDALYNKLTKTLNKEKRFNIMYEIETIVSKELPWIMLLYESTYIAHHRSIKNFRKSFFIRNYVKYLQKD